MTTMMMTTTIPTKTTMTTKSRGLTVRARTMALMVSLTTVALVLVSLTLWAAEVRRVDTLISAQLERVHAEFSSLATAGINPQTGQPFDSLDALLREQLAHHVPLKNESTFGIVGGAVTLAQTPLSEVNPQLAEDAASAPLDRVRIETSSTVTGDYRWLIVPVSIGEEPPGALVVAHDRTAELAPVYSTLATVTLIGVGALILLSAVGWFLLGRLLSPVKEMRLLSREIANSDFSRRLPVRGTDDLAELSRSFNDMVDHVTNVLASQRQLLDDAGHELRTPITVVRGHVELMDSADPSDVEAARALALGELDRMHRLTEDLVLLARTETPELLRWTSVDVDEFTREVFQHAQHLGPREWELSDVAHVVMRADADRLTQALLQLAANAVKFSEAGSAVTLASTIRDSRVEFSVADRGRGIARENLELIFERFAQVGERRDGSGLGLAIVRGIARSHGGDVEVSSVVGAGSEFTLWVPMVNAE